MKIFKLMVVALVAMLGFTACDNEPEHIYDDHSADIVGTWTCLTENYAEALIINADGTAVSYGVEDGEYWENVRGTVSVKENKITMIFEDDDNLTGHFDIIPGMAFSLFEDSGERYTYQYCANDLSDEIIGMWVCTAGPDEENDMAVETFNEDGSAIFTGFSPENDEMVLNSQTSYKVIGDLMFHTVAGSTAYVVTRMVYSPNATKLGDIMSFILSDNSVFTRLRIKQYLELPGMKYDYIKTFVSNVKGLDKDINFMGYTINFAKMDGSELDKLLKAILFNVEFPDANTLKYSYNYNNVKATLDASIVVEGNKMTIKMSKEVSTLKDVVLYAFQDADCSQLHFYMNKTAFVNFHTNMQAKLMESMDEQFDINNADAVNAIYNEINNTVQSINVSLVMTKAK